MVIKIYELFLPGINLEFLGIYYRNEQIIQYSLLIKLFNITMQNLEVW